MEYHNLLKNCNSFDEFQKEIERRNLSLKEWNERVLVTYPNKMDENRDNINFGDPLVRESKGIILSKDPLQVVCYGMNKFEDMTPQLEQQLRDNWDRVTVESCIDGSLIKLYFYDGEWRISTNRCIEARKANWSSYRSFYEMVQEASSDLNYDCLNKNFVYSFILCHPANRIVTNYTVPSLVHVATRDLINTLEYELPDPRFEAQISLQGQDIGMPVPMRHTVESYDKFQELLKDVDAVGVGFVLKYREQGENSFHRVRFESPQYQHVKEVKGNHQDLVARYLWLQRNDPQMFAEFCTWYPEFGWIEHQLFTLARDAHTSYMEHFVNKNKQFIPNKDYWELLTELHTEYYRTKVPTTTQRVLAMLRSYPIDKLSRLLQMK